MNTHVESNLTTVFLHHQHELQQFLIRKVNCSETADDLIQETYLRIAELNEEIVIMNHRAFLYRVASNLALDHLRSRVRRAQWDGGAVTEECVCTQPQPECVLLGQEKMAHFIQLLYQLPLKSRTLFVLYRIEGKSSRQIANEMRIPQKSVERIVQQTLKLLKPHVDWD